MFASGTQRKHWMFTGVSEIELLRNEANQRYIKAFGNNMDVSISTCTVFSWAVVLIILNTFVAEKNIKIFMYFLAMNNFKLVVDARVQGLIFRIPNTSFIFIYCSFHI